MEGSMTRDTHQEETERKPINTDIGQTETNERALTLVLLGSAGAGKSTAVDAILGGPSDSSTGPETAVTTESQKRCATVTGRQVTIVDTPECLCIERPAEDVRRQFSLCAALSSPGPHAFLLCVPVHRPSNLELQILETIEKVFGPEAVSKHAMVLFTRMDRMSEDVSLDEYLNTQRADLLELVQKCGGRHHPQTAGTNAEEQETNAKELLEKVERMVKETGTKFYTCPLLREAERRVQEKEEEILRNRRERGEDDSCTDAKGIRAEAERSVDDLPVEGIADLCLSIPNSSFIHWLWDTVVGWFLWLPSMVRGSTLLGSFVGLFVGGPLGGAMGATVGSVATEVGRRKQKTK